MRTTCIGQEMYPSMSSFQNQEMEKRKSFGELTSEDDAEDENCHFVSLGAAKSSMKRSRTMSDGNYDDIAAEIFEDKKLNPHSENLNLKERLDSLTAHSDEELAALRIDKGFSIRKKAKPLFQPREIIKMLYVFYDIPAVKFRYHAFSHIVLVSLLSYTMLIDWEYSLHWREIAVYCIILGFALEESRELFFYSKMKDLRSYLSSKWNLIDILALTFAILGFLIRLTKLHVHVFSNTAINDYKHMESNFDDITWYSARICLALACMLYWVRLLYISTVLETVGPKLKMIGTMIAKDMFPFLFILFIFIFGFGVLIHGLLYPNGFHAWNDAKMTSVQIFMNMIKICFYSMVGDYGLDVMLGDDSCDRILHAKQNNTLKCAHPYGRYIVPYIVLPLYVIVTEILLLNLIIALFSKTVEEIDSQSQGLWQFERHDLIEEFTHRSPRPPPLNIIEMLRSLICRIMKMCSCNKKAGSSKCADQTVTLQFLLFQAFALRNNRGKLKDDIDSSPNSELLMDLRKVVREELSPRQVCDGKKSSDNSGKEAVEDRISSVKGSYLESAPVRDRKPNRLYTYEG